MSTSTITVPVQIGHVNNLRNRYQNSPAADDGLQVNGPALALHGVNVANRINAIDNPPVLGNGAQPNPPAFSIPRVSVQHRVDTIEAHATPRTAPHITTAPITVAQSNIPHASVPQADVPRIDVPETDDVPRDIAEQNTGPHDSFLAQMKTDVLSEEARDAFELGIAEERSGMYYQSVNRKEAASYERHVPLPAAKSADAPLTPPESPHLRVVDDVEANRSLIQANLRDAAFLPIDGVVETKTGDIRPDTDNFSHEALNQMYQAPGERQNPEPRPHRLARSKPWWQPASTAPLQNGGPGGLAQETAQPEAARQITGPRRDRLARSKPWWEPASTVLLQNGGPRGLAQETARPEAARQITGPRPQPANFNRRPTTPPRTNNSHLPPTPPGSTLANSNAGDHESPKQHQAPPETPQIPVATELAAATAGEGDGDENDDGKTGDVSRGSGCAGDMGMNHDDDENEGKTPEGTSYEGCAGLTSEGCQAGEETGTIAEGESETAALSFVGPIGAWLSGILVKVLEKVL
ncbi:hypothetical protein EG327_007234 [Venturia inaequalis]|uniref:Uncharacterized protein n=1 Tax=Venturia inaequalis TaxID=5025 RepID=A0A8H3VQZ7_VENIN|nr:hypothetical protein EG327_007234 [Venturia inaequalis]